MTVLSPTSPWHPRRLARTAGFVLAAVAVAGGAFLTVLHFQPAMPAGGVTTADPRLPESLGPEPQLTRGVGTVERPVFNNFEGGKLVSDFTADDFSPRKDSRDGMVDVVRPRARFYMKDKQVLTVTGETGEVQFGPAGSANNGGFLASGTKMPDTGKLHRVHIGLFLTLDAPRPTLTMDTDNVRFDNDTLRLYTEKIPATATAPEVAADMVPVVVGGDDYEMYGTGLTLRLAAGQTPNDRQLHLLEVAHGNRLTILHPAAMGTRHDAPVAVQSAAPVASVPIVSADPATAGLAVPAKGVPAPQAYRAVFNDHVRITEGALDVPGHPDRTIGIGDVLTVDFAQKRSAPDDKAHAATTKPATPPAHAPADPGPTTVPTTVAATPASRPVTVTTTTTRPAGPGQEPITVYWSGKLRVTPWDPGSTMMPLDAGDAAVRLAGRPAVLTYNGATAEAAVATYRAADHAVRLEPSPACPVVHLSQPMKGLAVDAVGVEYDPATSVATIRATPDVPATLHMTEAGRRTGMTVTWTDRGLLHVVTTAKENDPSGVDHVDLAGDVRASDPRFSLASRRLLLDLDAPPATTAPSVATTKPVKKDEARLRRMTAVGNVVCRLLRPGLPDEGIEGDRLVVGMAPTADGSSAPHDVQADGRQVHAFDADQALYADHLAAILAPKPSVSPPLRGGSQTTPAKRGANGKEATTSRADGDVALESLVATGNVKAVLKNGSTAVGDVLRETTSAAGRQFVELSGNRGARVTDAKQNELVGPVLHVTDQGVVVVDGPGTLHTVRRATTKPATVATTLPTAGKPIDVSWTDGLSYDPAANGADVVGHVIVRSVDPNGTVNNAVGDRAHIDFEDAPPSKDKKEAADAAGANLGNKQAKVVTLIGHMTATSDLTVDGIVLRHGELHGDRLIYTTADGVARVPGPGRMLVENHKPATGTAAGAAGRGSTGGKFGTMAVGWKEGMTYDQASDTIRMTGDVRVGFLQDSAKNAEDGPMRMRSDVLVITLRKVTGKGDSVSDLLATGAVHMTTRTLDVHCHAADLRPDANLLVATGTDAEPGRAVDMGGRGVGSAGGEFSRMEFDTAQETVRHVEGASGSFRR
jgi:hypothetical protein